MSWMSWLQVYWLIHNFRRISIIRWSEFACLTAGWSVSYLPMCVSVYLSVDVCSYLCAYIAMCLCVYMCIKHCVCLSVCLSVVCLAVGLYDCFSFSQSVCLYLSVCLFACLCLSRSVSQSVSLLSVVRRSVVGLPQLSVSHGPHEACKQRRGGCWKRESGRLRTQEQQATHTRATDWADGRWAQL